jgi:hypothetical protein
MAIIFYVVHDVRLSLADTEEKKEFYDQQMNEIINFNPRKI